MNLKYFWASLKKCNNKRNIIQLTYCPISHGEKAITIEREIATAKTPKSIKYVKFTPSSNVGRNSISQPYMLISKKQLK